MLRYIMTCSRDIAERKKSCFVYTDNRVLIVTPSRDCISKSRLPTNTCSFNDWLQTFELGARIG